MISLWVGGNVSIAVSAVAKDVVNVTAFVLDTTAGVVSDAAEFTDEQTDVLQDEADEENPKE